MPYSDPAKRAACRAAWVARNPDKVRAAAARRYQTNPQPIQARSTAWKLRNAERIRAYNAARHAAAPHKARAQRAVWRASAATPAWLTSQQRAEMLDWYQRASALDLEVDHIVPIRGKVVCGLHVPWNLQLMAKIDNQRKGNRTDGSIQAEGEP